MSRAMGRKVIKSWDRERQISERNEKAGMGHLYRMHSSKSDKKTKKISRDIHLREAQAVRGDACEGGIQKGSDDLWYCRHTLQSDNFKHEEQLWFLELYWEVKKPLVQIA